MSQLDTRDTRAQEGSTTHPRETKTACRAALGVGLGHVVGKHHAARWIIKHASVFMGEEHVASGDTDFVTLIIVV